MITKTIFAPRFDVRAVDAMGTAACQLIEELKLQDPVECFLLDQTGERIARCVIGGEDEPYVSQVEARLRSQLRAALHLKDAQGREALVQLEIGSRTIQ